MFEAVLAGHSCTSDGMIRSIWVVGMGQRGGRKGNGASGSPLGREGTHEASFCWVFLPHPIGLGVNQELLWKVPPFF